MIANVAAAVGVWHCVELCTKYMTLYNYHCVMYELVSNGAHRPLSLSKAYIQKWRGRGYSYYRFILS